MVGIARTTCFVGASLFGLAGCAAGSNGSASGSGGSVAVSDSGGTGGVAGASGAGGIGGNSTGGMPSIAGCNPDEIAAACGAAVCGPAPGCAASCGECEPNTACSEGRCLPLVACDGGECACGDLEFTITTRQACSIASAPGSELDGEAFITVGGQEHRVLAIDRWGSGHLIAWCDASTVGPLMEAFDAAGYLAQRAMPRVASFGNESTCKPGVLQPVSIPDSVTYLGSELPAQYLSDAAALADDWDALVFCGFHTTWTPEVAPVLQQYVTEHGRGLLALMDYEGFDVRPEDFQSMSAVTAPSGITFNPLNLEWSDATASVAIECVPDLRPFFQ